MSEDLPALVEQARGGDRTAFARLVEGHGRVAAGVAYGILGDPHLAADAVQEAFFKAYQGLGSLRDSERFLSWFLTIVRSTATDVARRRTRWGSKEVPMADSLADGLVEGGENSSSRLLAGVARDPSPEDTLLQGEEAKRIRTAMMALTDEYREVIILKHLEGHSYREIARLLKTSVRAVESRLFRARQQLHRLLGRGRLNGSKVAGSDPGSDAPDRPLRRRRSET